MFRLPAWAWRHVIYFSLLAPTLPAATDLAEHANTVVDFGKWVSLALLTSIAWYAREQVKEIRATKDAQIANTAAISSLANTMKRIEAAVGALAENQAKITVEVVQLTEKRLADHAQLQELRAEHNRFKHLHIKGV